MILQVTRSLSEVMCGLCQAISQAMENCVPSINTRTHSALDVASGYHSYVSKIKDYQQKV